ncbi:MAG: TIM barrel protein [Candidatus Latescibacteria bacterium]|nr:TIM barrel protein [Candidatus Latescibacterota bacterium]
MRFGLSGTFLPANMDDFTSAIAQRVKGLGFSGVFCRFRDNDPFATTPAQCHRLRDLCADQDLHIYQVSGYWQQLMAPDETVRRQAVRVVQEALRVAGDLGARGIDTGPGSLAPAGPWHPHGGNWDPEIKDQLIKSLQECAQAAADHGVYLSLEGHQVVVLDSAETTREVLDAVDSPWVRSDLDPANWITLKTVFNTGAAIDRMFDVLGHHIVSGHAKDISIAPSHIIHMPTDAPGTGQLDFSTYIRRMEALDPEYPLIVEGASTDQLPATSAFLHQTAADLGIAVLD